MILHKCNYIILIKSIRKHIPFDNNRIMIINNYLRRIPNIAISLAKSKTIIHLGV